MKKLTEANDISFEVNDKISSKGMKKKMAGPGGQKSFFLVAAERIEAKYNRGTFSVARAELSILYNIEEFINLKSSMDKSEVAIGIKKRRKERISKGRKYEYSLLNTILGGNMSSRLFQEIREKRGFAYAVYSFISSYVDTCMFGVYECVHPENAFKSVELILKEIFKIKKGRIDPDELRYAKEFTKGNLMLASESNDNQMVRMAQTETHYGRYIPLEEVVNKIEAVTEDDICNLAETLFPAHRFALTLLGPITDKDEFDDMLGPSDL